MGEDAQHPQADIEQPCRNDKPVWLSNETLSRSAVMSTPDAGFLLSIYQFSLFFLQVGKSFPAVLVTFSRVSCIVISLLMTVTVTVLVYALDTWTHDGNRQILACMQTAWPSTCLILMILIWI